MKIDENTYTLIDAYLKGTLNEKDVIDFKNKLKNDPELNEEFLHQKNLFETINKQDWPHESNPDTEDVKVLGDYFNSQAAKKTKEVIHLAQKEYKAKKARVINLKYLYPMAAAILILFGYFNFFGNSSTEKLYHEYKDWSSLPSLTERFDNATDLSKGEQFFKNENYQKAVAIFKVNIDSTNKNPQILAYLGASYLELGDYKSATETFDDLLATNSLDKTKAYWYKALILLKQNQKKEALKMIDTIITKETNYNYTKAIELKTKLIKL
jgi:tetratricopeptide (TPR) repeat protein